MNNFIVDILTPSKVIAKSIPSEDVLVPTEKGQIEVKKDHTHIVEKLGTGIVTLFGGSDDSDRYFMVTNGICKVLNDRITILSNTAEESHTIDSERAQASLDHAQDKLKNETLDDDEIIKYRRKVERAQLRLQLAKYSK